MSNNKANDADIVFMGLPDAGEEVIVKAKRSQTVVKKKTYD